MKKILAALVSMVLALSLSACCCMSLVKLNDKGSAYSWLSNSSDYFYNESSYDKESENQVSSEIVESKPQDNNQSTAQQQTTSSQPTPKPDVDCLQLKKQELIDSYGMASQEQFISCLGTEIQDYPRGIMGIIAMYDVDVDGDSVKELIVIKTDAVQMAMHPVIVMQIYKNQNGTATHCATNTIYELSFCAAANIYMFYSQPLGKYCVMVDTATGGSYTGVNSWDATVFTISNNEIVKYKTWSNVQGFDMSTDFDGEFKRIGAPYARYCTQYDNRSSDANYLNLCQVEHEVYGDLSTYLTRNHKLAIK